MQYNASAMLDEIQKKREKMIESAKAKGFTSDDTIRYSQELDRLIYEYQCHSKRTGRKEEEVKVVFKQMMMVLPQVHIFV